MGLRAVGGRGLEERVRRWMTGLPEAQVAVIAVVVLGRELDAATVGEVAGATEDEVAGVMKGGVAARVLPEGVAVPAPVREAVLARVHPSVRTRLAARLAGVLAERPDVPAGRIAELYLAAGSPQAVDWCRRAAAEAASPEEAACWMRALGELELGEVE